MLTAWILGSFFFVFIVCFLLYVLRTEVSRPEPVQEDRSTTVSPPADHLRTTSGKYLITRDYRIVFGPRVFVNYPFGVQVVFDGQGTSGPTLWKRAETNRNPRSNVQRPFRESEYHAWPRSALEDPELTVIGGHIEFESEEAEPVVRVELQSARESFQIDQAVKKGTLKQDEEVIFSFWLNPLASEVSSLTVVISCDGRMAEVTTAGNGKETHELAAVSFTVPVTSFPIPLR